MQPNGNPPASPWGEHADLDRFGQQAAPQHAFPPGLETVADGDYDVEVLEAAIAVVEASKVVRADLKLLNAGGRVIQHTWWLNRQNAVNGYLADMQALGFPAKDWGGKPGQAPLSVAIPDCVRRLPGVRFRARKATRHVEAKPAGPGQAERKAGTYHDLHVAGRISGAPMPGAPAQQAPGTPTRQPAAMPAPGQSPPTPAGVNLDDVPF